MPHYDIATKVLIDTCRDKIVWIFTGIAARALLLSRWRSAFAAVHIKPARITPWIPDARSTSDAWILRPMK